MPINNIENEQIEFKKTTNEVEDSLVSIAAILNKHQKGIIYFGLRNDGTPFEQEIKDSTLRDISRKIYEHIKPQIYPIINTDVVDNVEVIKVEFKGSDIPYSCKGKYYLRVADENKELSPGELKKMMIQNEYKLNFGSYISDETIDDVNDDTLIKFHKDATSCKRLPDMEYDKEKLLKKLGLIKDNHLTNAGKLLFSKNKPIVLKTAIFATDQKVTFLDIQRYEGNIFELIDKAINYIKVNINWRVEFNGGIQRIEVPEIPIDAIREAIINSFAHARYDSRIQHEIDIFSNRITITNPGCFANENTPLDYASKDLKSCLRNEEIAKILFLCNDVETFGYGIKKVYTLCKQNNIEISYQNNETDFSLEFKRKVAIKEKLETISSDYLSFQEKTVLGIIIEKPNSNLNDLISATMKSKSSINRIIKSLAIKKLIIREGSDKTGKWVINYENLQNINDENNKNASSNCFKNEIVNETVNEPVNGTVNSQEKILLKLLLENPELTLSNLSIELKKSISTTKRMIKSLISRNIIIRVGPDKSGRWIVNYKNLKNKNGKNNKRQFSKEINSGTANEPENETVNEPENGTVNEPVNNTENGLLNLQEKIVLKIINEHPGITVNELSIKTKKSERTIKRVLSYLTSKGIIKRVGSDKVGYWEII